MFKANIAVNMSIYDDALLTGFTMMPVTTLPEKSMLQFLLCLGSSNSTTDWMQVMMLIFVAVHTVIADMDAAVGSVHGLILRLICRDERKMKQSKLLKPGLPSLHKGLYGSRCGTTDGWNYFKYINNL